MTGVSGFINSDEGQAVIGFSNSLTGNGAGVVGSGNGPISVGVYGGVGQRHVRYVRVGRRPTTATGVGGWNQSFTGETRGVSGLVYSDAGAAIFGQATSTTGVTNGVYGQVASTTGRAVEGWATAGSGLELRRLRAHQLGRGLRRLVPGARARERHAVEVGRLVQDRPSAGPREPDALALVRGVARHEERLRRRRHHRRGRPGDGRAARLVRGAEPRLPLPAHGDRRRRGVRAGEGRARDRGEPLRRPHERREREGVVAGHRHPPGRLRRAAPHPRRGVEAGVGARPLPEPGRVRRGSGARGRARPEPRGASVGQRAAVAGAVPAAGGRAEPGLTISL